jgi:putrescine aminotransferase
MDADRLHEKVLRQYAEHLNPYLSKLMHFAGFGVEVRAEGCWIWDHEGRAFLDCLGGYGVFALGHRHPKVVEAVKRQLDLMPMSGKAFFNPPQAELATRLADLAPENLQYTFFSNSGTESVEAALKFAKCATGRTKVVSTLGGYHGKTIGALSATGREKYRQAFEPLMPGPDFVPYGDASALERAVDAETAAVIVEPIQGEGGIRVPPEGYLRACRDACNRTGALLILDEVQTGIGRTGLMFACEREAVRPDLMTLAKALGGGVMPIGATMGTPAVWEAVFASNPLLHTSTFGGNQLACVAGLATLDVIQEEGLLDRSRRMGERLKSGLAEVGRRHPDLVQEVRGVGLMVGVEFREDEVGELTIAQMMKRGVAAAYTLNNPRVIRFEPPLIIESTQVDQAIEVFESSVAETSEMLSALA